MSNTSPLTNLAAIDRFELLRQLHGELAIADGVWAKLNTFGKVWPGHDEVAAASWVERQTASNTLLVETLRRNLN